MKHTPAYAIDFDSLGRHVRGVFLCSTRRQQAIGITLRERFKTLREKGASIVTEKEFYHLMEPMTWAHHGGYYERTSRQSFRYALQEYCLPCSLLEIA